VVNLQKRGKDIWQKSDKKMCGGNSAQEGAFAGNTIGFSWKCLGGTRCAFELVDK